MPVPNGPRGYLIDVDGTLLDNDRAIPGAGDAILRLRESSAVFRITTNTTRRPCSATAAVLCREGIEVDAAEILAPAALARLRIVRSGKPRAALLVPAEARVEFDGVEEVDTRPDWVVVGDIGREFTWERLNQAFHWIRDGATLLALHRNRSWIAGDAGLVLDAGPFVAALEYALDATAEVVGKPSVNFFELAIGELGLKADEVAVVGDDPESDVAGGAAAGCRTILVRTGKFTGGDLSGAAPDAIVDSIADVF